MSTPPHGWAGEGFRLLCEVGRTIAAPPDDASVLARIAHLATRSVAGLCTVDVVGPDGFLVRVASAHRDPAHEQAARELRRFPAELDDPADPFARVARTGEPLLVAHAGEWLDAHVADGEHRALLRAVGARSLVAAPLAARGRVLGLLTLVSADAGRPYDAEVVALAEELGRRAALAVDPARARADVPGAGTAEARFMAAMSHEFRTPVHIAAMFAELLILGVPEPVPASARSHAERIRAATRHLDHLVEQVLAFSRLDARRDAVRAEPVELAALARDTAALVEPLARQKGLGFGTDVPGEPLEGITDPGKLRQVLFNLLGNAVKFTASGEIRLALRVEGERAVFEVRDTGVGIAPEHRERIFEPFWQVERAPAAESRGTGLGLGIVRHLVRLLQGQVAVESDPGRGSTFRIVLPLRREASRAPAPACGEPGEGVDGA